MAKKLTSTLTDAEGNLVSISQVNDGLILGQIEHDFRAFSEKFAAILKKHLHMNKAAAEFVVKIKVRCGDNPYADPENPNPKRMRMLISTASRMPKIVKPPIDLEVFLTEAEGLLAEQEPAA